MRSLNLKDEHVSYVNKGENWVEDPGGCPEIEQLEYISKHEANCGFAFIACKYSTKCEKARR